MATKSQKQYWLMKTEAECYGIDDLARDKVIAWEGVRNYQARNFMMQSMNVGDSVFFYHSNGTKQSPAGIYGVARVASSAHPDMSQFDPSDKHFDPKAKRDKPIWYCVDVAFAKKWKTPLYLADIKLDPNLSGIMVAQTGSRLSVQPVSQKHGEYLLKAFK
jgi:predicted RNA-binding protein with PUA-like domain